MQNGNLFDQPRRVLTDEECMKSKFSWFSEHGDIWLKILLDDLEGLFQP